MVRGQPSVNPSGRPAGAKGLARYIAEQTSDGRELVDRLLTIAREDDQARRVIDAIAILLDRLAGKPLASHEILSATVQLDRPPAGFDALPVDEKRALIAARLAGMPGPGLLAAASDEAP